MTISILVLIVLLFAGILVIAGAVAGVVLLVSLSRRGSRKPPALTPPGNPNLPPPIPPANCPRCGSAMPANAPQGLCPRCVLGMGLAPETETGGDVGPHGTKIVVPPQDEVARRFPHLEIIDCLGQGGMGVVYKARQPKLNRLVALKILTPERGADPRFAERFLREAQALARLNHPNIVTIHDYGEADGMFFLLMEYVDGTTLRQLMRGGQVAPREALAIIPQICDALQYAHDLGIVHRDIKPDNILMDRLGRVKVADFGLAKLVGIAGEPLNQEAASRGSPGLTQTGKILGTPNYIAPEQLEHPEAVDHRADIYALGVVLYQMLTGELPGESIEPPSKLVQVDVRFDEVVLRALEKDPSRRYSQASAFRTHVEAIATNPPPVGTSPATKPENRRESRNIGTLLLTIGSHLLLLLLWASFFVVVVPQFMSEFEPLGVRLPSSLRLVFNLSAILKHAAILLIPILLFADIGICILLWRFSRARWLQLWSITLVMLLGGMVVFAGLSLARYSYDSSSLALADVQRN